MAAKARLSSSRCGSRAPIRSRGWHPHSGRHFAGSNFYWYLRDPAGSFLELYSDLDRITDDAAWEARGRTPMSLEHSVNAWGPNLPTEFVVPADLEELEAGWATVGS